MNRLKPILADKILEINSLQHDNVAETLSDINLFRNYIEKYSELIEQHPSVETELISLIQNNIYDIESVNFIFEKYNDHPNKQEILNSSNLSELEKLTRQFSGVVISDDPSNMKEQLYENLINEPYPITEVDTGKYNENSITNHSNKRVTSNDESESKQIIKRPKNRFRFGTSKKISTKDLSIKSFQILAVIAIILLLIFGTVFVIRHWQLVLWIIGGLIALSVLVWFVLLIKKSNQYKSE